jgi:hypothetical protein
MAGVPSTAWSGSAIVTSVTVRLVKPKALDKRKRSFSAPSETWNVCRMVELKKTDSLEF